MIKLSGVSVNFGMYTLVKNKMPYQIQRSHCVVMLRYMIHIQPEVVLVDIRAVRAVSLLPKLTKAFRQQERFKLGKLDDPILLYVIS